MGGALDGAKNAVGGLTGGAKAEKEYTDAELERATKDIATQPGDDRTDSNYSEAKVLAEVRGHHGHGDVMKDTAIDATQNAKDLADQQKAFAEEQEGKIDEEARGALLDAATNAQETAQEALERAHED